MQVVLSSELDPMQEVLSHARGSMSISCKGFYPPHARGSVYLVQVVLSLEWFMQGVLASYARGSVIKVAEYMTQ